MNQQASPIDGKRRLEWIDAARGFAIFGIFIVNVGSFSAPYFLYGGGEEAWPAPIDQMTQTLIDIFFQASFYTLFSILFGFGFQLLIDRTRKKMNHITPFLLRRLLILIGFGLVHAFLVWHGDILLSYGIIGLLLLAFIGVKDRTLLVWAGIIFFGFISFFSFSLFMVRDLLGGAITPAIEQALMNYQSSSIMTIWEQNYNDWMAGNAGGLGIIMIGTVILPLFLFGMYMARKRWFHEPKRYRSVLVKLAVVSFILFVGFKMVPHLFGNPIWFSQIQDNLGGAASALFYMSVITLIAGSNLGMKLIKPFTYVGRMALTNYIFQSIISIILFYGIGFGLYGSVRPIAAVFIVIVIYTFQVLASKWWFNHFRFGPLEWIWRSLNYKKKQPFRK